MASKKFILYNQGDMMTVTLFFMRSSTFTALNRWVLEGACEVESNDQCHYSYL